MVFPSTSSCAHTPIVANMASRPLFSSFVIITFLPASSCLWSIAKSKKKGRRQKRVRKLLLGEFLYNRRPAGGPRPTTHRDGV